MKKLFGLVILLVILGLALPVSNLFAKPDNSGRVQMQGDDEGGVAAILEQKCVVCHIRGAELPFYAKLEHVVEGGVMPPMQFKLMHWDAGLSANEKAALLARVKKVRAERYATGVAATRHANAPIQPLVAPVDIDPELAALGKRMFHDKRLSGDDTVSCASCHALDTGGVDRLRFSKGIEDQVGGINAPTASRRSTSREPLPTSRRRWSRRGRSSTRG